MTGLAITASVLLFRTYDARSTGHAVQNMKVSAAPTELRCMPLPQRMRNVAELKPSLPIKSLKGKSLER